MSSGLQWDKIPEMKWYLPYWIQPLPFFFCLIPRFSPASPPFQGCDSQSVVHQSWKAGHEIYGK